MKGHPSGALDALRYAVAHARDLQLSAAQRTEQLWSQEREAGGLP